LYLATGTAQCLLLCQRVKKVLGDLADNTSISISFHRIAVVAAEVLPANAQHNILCDH
jgi:hypothetical protein